MQVQVGLSSGEEASGFGGWSWPGPLLLVAEGVEGGGIGCVRTRDWQLMRDGVELRRAGSARYVLGMDAGGQTKSEPEPGCCCCFWPGDSDGIPGCSTETAEIPYTAAAGTGASVGRMTDGDRAGVIDSPGLWLPSPDRVAAGARQGFAGNLQ